MLHTRRKFSVADISTAGELANKLKDYSWCLCNGFRFKGTLWVNDSTSEDAIQEYAVVREADMLQLESITVSWCTPEKLRGYVEELADIAAAQEKPEFNMGTVTNEIETPKEHGSCDLCR